MTGQLEISVILPAPPQTVYADWLNSEVHSAFTGSPAHIHAAIGGMFSAWDRYIEGKTLELDEGVRIKQSWRTSDFPLEAGDSLIEVILDPVMHGDIAATHLTIRHTKLPPGSEKDYERGWQEYYFQPMLAYYNP